MLEFSAMSTPALTNASPDYLAAIEAAAYHAVPDPGCLLISGETRREYIQRQTTNDIGQLAADRALPTFLTAPTGRIFEHYILLESDGAIAILTQPGHGPGNAAYFQKRVFFNDQVAVQDRSAEFAQIEILGPRSPELLARFGLSKTPEVNEVVEANWQQAGLQTFGLLGFGAAPRFRALLPSTLAARFTSQLGDTPALSFANYEALRIESGLAGDPEFAAETTPYELGMEEFVSTTKGCYTGQEVLARQVTYDKVVRRLVRLQAAEPLASGASLSAEGKTVGQITSAAVSPRLGPIALGVVRKPHDTANTELLAQSPGGALTVKVV